MFRYLQGLSAEQHALVNFYRAVKEVTGITTKVVCAAASEIIPWKQDSLVARMGDQLKLLFPDSRHFSSRDEIDEIITGEPILIKALSGLFDCAVGVFLDGRSWKPFFSFLVCLVLWMCIE